MHFPPFRPVDLGGPPERAAFQVVSVPGKVMAYTALGDIRPELVAELDRIYDERLEIRPDFAETRLLLEWTYSPAHHSTALVEALAAAQVAALRELVDGCLTGGTAGPRAALDPARLAVVRKQLDAGR